MTHLIKTGLSRIITVMLPSRVASLRVNSTTTSSDAIVHLHTTRTRLLHINGRVLTCSLCCLAHWIHLPHLDHGAFIISLSM